MNNQDLNYEYIMINECPKPKPQCYENLFLAYLWVTEWAKSTTEKSWDWFFKQFFFYWPVQANLRPKKLKIKRKKGKILAFWGCRKKDNGGVWSSSSSQHRCWPARSQRMTPPSHTLKSENGCFSTVVSLLSHIDIWILQQSCIC